MCIPDSTNALLQTELSLKSLSPEEDYIIKVTFYILIIQNAVLNSKAEYFLFPLQKNLQVETGNLTTEQSWWWVKSFFQQFVSGQGRKNKKERKSNPELIDCSFFMTLCELLCTNCAHVCPMSNNGSCRLVVWSAQEKPSGVPVERNVLVQLQTWQPRSSSFVTTQEIIPQPGHRRWSMEMNWKQKQIYLQVQRCTHSHTFYRNCFT